MIDITFQSFWEEVLQVMIIFRLWPLLPIVMATLLLGGLAIWFIERLFGVGGGGDA